MGFILLLPFIIHGTVAKSSWECIAVGKEIVPNGHTYVPGPDYCTVCKCEKGNPRLCKAVFCQPPQDCKSFRLGNSCCDFHCTDNMLPNLPDGFGGGGMSTDLGLRMVASAVTAILSLALLLFLVHRLRQRRVRAQQQYYEDQLYSPNGGNHDSCHSNPCCQNAAYCSGNDHVDFFLDGNTPPYSLWKPPSFYFPHRDAPPPYSEVDSNSRNVRDTEPPPLPPLRPIMVQLPNQSSDNNCGPLAVFGAIGGTCRNQRSSPQQPCCITSLPRKQREVTLRSDEIYEDVSDVVPLDLPPPYSLNDLNRDTTNTHRVPEITGPRSSLIRQLRERQLQQQKQKQEQQLQKQQQQQQQEQQQKQQQQQQDTGGDRDEATGTSVTSAEGVRGCVCEGKDATCSLCNFPQQPGVSSNKDNISTPQQQNQHNIMPVRLRGPKPNASPRKRERESAAALEEFQLRLSMDISDSSISSDPPTRTFSSSSEDSTSMDITSEMR